MGKRASLINRIVFDDNPNCIIYVQPEDLEWYSTATNWSTLYAQDRIKSIEDFKGVTIRTMENKYHQAAFEAFGAMPIAMNYNDVFPALQTGTIDACENATSNCLNSGYYEVTKNVTYTQHAFVYILLCMSDDAWDRIPEDLREPFLAAVQEGVEYERNLLNEANADAVEKLKDLGLQPTAVSCRIDYLGRMTIEAEATDANLAKLRRAVIVHEMNKLCGRKFDTPAVTTILGTIRITMCERPCLDIEIAASQHICGSGRLCGDSFRYFNDGMGRMIVVLSDGMGTGGRAAVDSGMAVSIMSKLVKAGLGFDCSLKVVNSALLVKSEDESLSTLDVVSVDLYSGVTDFMKAGAALSFLKKDGDMYRVETPSVPVGILPEAELIYTEDTLAPDDIIVMVSDGAIATGEQWIERIISKWEDNSMQELANLINDEATARRNDGHDDDITVIAMRIIKQ